MYDKKKNHVRVRQISTHDVAGTKKIQKVKPKIKSKTIGKRCEFCGKLVTQNKRCRRCRKTICDDCAKADSIGRYCPKCFDKIKSVSKLA